MFSMYSSMMAEGDTKSQLPTAYSESPPSASASEMSAAICSAFFSPSFFCLRGPLSPLHGESNFLSGTRSHSMPRQYGWSKISCLPAGPQPKRVR